MSELHAVKRMDITEDELADMQREKGRVYLAGPMTGYPNLNRDWFNFFAAELTSQGYLVMNPAVFPLGFEEHHYMRLCMGMVEACDHIALLPNAWESSGARAEIMYAQKLGHKTMQLEYPVKK